MTPEQEALREKVAREIYDILEGPVADQDFGRQTRQWELSLVLADTAIAVVLKEAARVAETPIEIQCCNRPNWGDDYSSKECCGNPDCRWGSPGEIAAAILSLIPQEEGK